MNIQTFAPLILLFNCSSEAPSISFDANVRADSAPSDGAPLADAFLAVDAGPNCVLPLIAAMQPSSGGNFTAMLSIDADGGCALVGSIDPTPSDPVLFFLDGIDDVISDSFSLQALPPWELEIVDQNCTKESNQNLRCPANVAEVQMVVGIRHMPSKRLVLVTHELDHQSNTVTVSGLLSAPPF